MQTRWIAVAAAAALGVALHGGAMRAAAGPYSKIGEIQIGGPAGFDYLNVDPVAKRLYVTNGASIVAFDVQGPGKLGNQREFVKLHDGGNGDGLAVDTDGRLYVAAGPGVQVYARDGKYLGVIPTPTSGRPTGQAFAGADRRTLYVVVQATTDFNGQTIAGRNVYRIPVLARGLADRSK